MITMSYKIFARNGCFLLIMQLNHEPVLLHLEIGGRSISLLTFKLGHLLWQLSFQEKNNTE